MIEQRCLLVYRSDHVRLQFGQTAHGEKAGAGRPGDCEGSLELMGKGVEDGGAQLFCLPRRPGAGLLLARSSAFQRNGCVSIF